jgi:hypothetical protein
MITYIIVSVVFIAISIIFFQIVLKDRRHKAKQLRMAKAYDRMVRQFKLAVEYSDFLCYRFIGLDRKNKKLLLIDYCRREKQELCIPLLEIGETRVIPAKDENQIIKAVLLELRNKRSHQVIRFSFYDREYDPVVELPSLQEKAIRWMTRIDIHKHAGPINFGAEFIL